MFDIGNFVTLGIVLVLIFVFRRLDRDNRSLEKVKRLAEKLRDELSEYVDRRAEDLKRYGIELDVQQRAAKVALEKLQAVQERLSSRTDSLAEIENRLTEYDRTLAGLRDMTARVDENLAQLQNESSFTDMVNKKLDAARRSIDAIEHELPLIREGFARDAAETLDSFKRDLLAEVTGSLDETKSILETARGEGLAAVERAERARREIEESLDMAFTRARAEAADVENIAFAGLREASDQRAEGLADIIEKRFREVGGEAREAAESIRRSIVDLRTDWDEESRALLSATREEIETAAAELSERLDAIRTGIDLAAGDARRASSVAGEARSELEAMESSLRSRLEATRTGIEEEFAAFGQAFEDHRTRFEAGFAEETAGMREGLRELGEGIEDLRHRAYAGMDTRMATLEEEFFAGLAARAEVLEAGLEEWRTKTDEAIASASALAAGKREAVDAQYAATLERELGMRTEVFGKESAAKLEALETAVRSRIDDIQGALAERERTLTATLDTIDGGVGELRSRLDRSVGETERSVASSLAELRTRFEDLAGRAMRHYETQRDVFENASRTEVERMEASLESLNRTGIELRDRLASLDEAVRLRGLLSADIARLEASRAELRSREADVTTLSSRLDAILRSQEEAERRETRLGVELARLEGVEENVRRLASLAQAVEAKIAQVAESGDRIAELQLGLRGLAELAGETESRYSRLEKKSAILDATTEAVDKNFQTLQNLEYVTHSIGEDLKTMPERVSSLAQELAGLAAAKTRADEATQTVRRIEESLSKSAEHMARADRIREWLARAETRLEELNRIAQERFKLLAGLLGDEDSAKDWTILPASIQETVRKLGRQGWAAEEIARTVKVARSEVELILDLDSRERD